MRGGGMRGGSFGGQGRPIFRPGRPLLRPHWMWWPGLWGFGCLLYPVLGMIGFFVLALLRLRI
jgi:hypothetical protein